MFQLRSWNLKGRQEKSLRDPLTLLVPVPVKAWNRDLISLVQAATNTWCVWMVESCWMVFSVMAIWSGMTRKRLVLRNHPPVPIHHSPLRFIQKSIQRWCQKKVSTAWFVFLMLFISEIRDSFLHPVSQKMVMWYWCVHDAGCKRNIS